MSSLELQQKLDGLPEQAKKEFIAFWNSLLVRYSQNSKMDVKRKAGFMKGTFVVKPGFDDPLNEFADYV